MKLDDLYLRALQDRLKEPLPGLEAQFRMAPGHRPRPGQDFSVPDNAKKSAVMLLLYEGSDGVHLPMIVRASYDGVHSDQVGLPGGQVEEGDRDYTHTALRETEEEIGIPQNQVEILGQLSMMYIPPSNFLVQPIIGRLHGPPTYKLDPTEVASLIEAPVAHFMDKEYLQEQASIKVRGGVRLKVPAFVIKGNIVWGATAMMMSEFAAVLKEL